MQQVSNHRFIDQMGNTISLTALPKRIVSLVPSQTELLMDLGLSDRLVGLTRFCIHPDHVRFEKKRVGGTKDVRLDRVTQLNPDLIIGNMEENDKDQIKALQEEFPVWMSNISTLSDALTMISEVGRMTGTSPKAEAMVSKIKSSFDALKRSTTDQAESSVLYMIWDEPAMCAGRGTFIDDMLQHCGYVNAVDSPRYPSLDNDSLQDLNPDHVFLSSEPYPYSEKHLNKYKKMFSQARVSLVDGEYFSWYGSRLLKSPSYFNNLLGEL